MWYFRFYDESDLIFVSAGGGGEITVGLNQSGSWKLTLLISEWNSEKIVTGNTVVINHDSGFYFTGYVQSVEEDLHEIKLSGLSRLDLMYQSVAYPYAYYEDSPILSVLGDLLYQVGWRLGDISTLPDPDQTTTVDLRGDSNLIKQIRSALENVRGFYRESQDVLGIPTIDIGIFGKNTGTVMAFSPDNPTLQTTGFNYLALTEEPKFKETTLDGVYALHAVGGNLDSETPKRSVDLRDALHNNPLLAVDPAYPIIEAAFNKAYYALNLTEWAKPGGYVRSVAEGTTQLGIGYSSSLQEESVIVCFTPFPGEFSHIFVWAGSTQTNLGNILSYKWALYLSEDPDTIGNKITGGELEYDPLPGSPVRIDLSGVPAVIGYYRLQLTVDTLAVAATTWTVKTGAALTEDYHPTKVFKVNESGDLDPSTSLSGYSPYTPVVEISTHPVGSNTLSFASETQSKYAPKDKTTSSTAEAKKAAGAALYDWVLAYFADREGEQAEYTAEVRSDLIPYAGDSVFYKGSSSQVFYNPITGQRRELQRSTEGYLRIDEATISTTEPAEIKLKLKKGNSLSAVDDLITIYDDLDKPETKEEDDYFSPWTLDLDKVTILLEKSNPNAKNSKGYDALQVDVSCYGGLYADFAAARASHADVILVGTPFTDSGDFYIELLSLPEWGEDASFSFLVSPTGSGWRWANTCQVNWYLLWR